MRAVCGRLLWAGVPGLDYFWNIVPGISRHPGNLESYDLSIFVISSKKKRAEISRRVVRKSCRDFSMSHMRPVQGQKLTVSSANFHLARPLDHRTQVQISRAGNPSLWYRVHWEILREWWGLCFSCNTNIHPKKDRTVHMICFGEDISRLMQNKKLTSISPPGRDDCRTLHFSRSHISLELKPWVTSVSKPSSAASAHVQQ